MYTVAIMARDYARTRGPLGLAIGLYKRLIPYPARLSLWTWRQRLARRAVFSPDRWPPRGATPAERIIIETVGKRALRESAFAQAVLAHSAGFPQPHPMLRTWVEYPLLTNARGEEVVRTLRQLHPPALQIADARTLDIGCAYGGTPIALARAGAEATGLEISAGLLALAEANLADQQRGRPALRCTLLVGDILQPAVVESVGGPFDIITCDNVIEHVEKASRLVETIACLLRAPHGVALIGIPNAYSVLQVARDGHYALFGLTLLDRADAVTYFADAGHADEYGVGEYTFTLDDYRQMFADAGLALELLHPPTYTAAAVEGLARQIAGLRSAYARRLTTGKIPTSVAQKVAFALDRYIADFETRYEAYRAATASEERAALGSRLLADYQDEQWQVVAR